MTESSNPRVSSLTTTHHYHHHPGRLSGKTLPVNLVNISTIPHQQTKLKRTIMATHLVDQQLLQLYYQNFHTAHPILIPFAALQGSLAEHIPTQLLTVMRYIGAHYHPDESIRQALRPSTLETTFSSAGADGFWVQCMLLLAISEHAHDGESSSRFIDLAVNRALELGMQDASFARNQGYASPLLEEMWRRTYWELYVVDVMLSALRHQPSTLYHTLSDVSLPCDEALYNEAEVSLPLLQVPECRVLM